MSDRPSESIPPITNREELRAYLWEACEIEQQLMIQYLFAAFTLKKHPDRSCSPAQLEAVRRWGSQVLMVARQEMEHLALANGILTAIAEDPFFARENIPVQSRYFLGQELAASRSPKEKVTPCDIPFVFERFTLDTIGRFVCAESPGYATLKKSCTTRSTKPSTASRTCSSGIRTSRSSSPWSTRSTSCRSPTWPPPTWRSG